MIDFNYCRQQNVIFFQILKQVRQKSIFKNNIFQINIKKEYFADENDLSS